MRQTLLTWSRPLVSRPMTALGVAFLVLMVLFAAFSPWIAPYPPDQIDPANGYCHPAARTFWAQTISGATRSAASSMARGWHF